MYLMQGVLGRFSWFSPSGFFIGYIEQSWQRPNIPPGLLSRRVTFHINYFSLAWKIINIPLERSMALGPAA